MAKKRNARSASFKSKVALEAIRERKTISELAKQHEVHPTQIHQWRRVAQDRLSELFEDSRTKRKRDDTDVTMSLTFSAPSVLS